jgi:hypothetical protein
VANFPPVSTTPAVTVAKFVTGVVDVHLHKFSEKFQMTQILFSRAWGKMIYEKNLKQKIS